MPSGSLGFLNWIWIKRPAGENCRRKHPKTFSGNLSAPVVTSLMSSAALWQPSTSRWVHVDRSLAESTRNTWVSTPCLVPERRPNERSESRRGELFPGPEWTSLTGEEERAEGGWGRKGPPAEKMTGCACLYIAGPKLRWKAEAGVLGKEVRGGGEMTHRFGLTNIFQMNVTLCCRPSVRPWKDSGCAAALWPEKNGWNSQRWAKTGQLEVGNVDTRSTLCTKWLCLHAHDKRTSEFWPGGDERVTLGGTAEALFALGQDGIQQQVLVS